MKIDYKRVVVKVGSNVTTIIFTCMNKKTDAFASVFLSLCYFLTYRATSVGNFKCSGLYGFTFLIFQIKIHI